MANTPQVRQRLSSLPRPSSANQPLLTFDKKRFLERIQARVLYAMERTILGIEELAKSKAPVRKVFNEKLAGKRANELLPTFRLRDKSTGKLVKIKDDFRATEQILGKANVYVMKHDLADELLTRSGRRSLELGKNVDRFITLGGRKFRAGAGSGGVDPVTGRLGGRLKREIHHTNPTREGSWRWRAWVISPTPYAKYVEFGTAKHGKAQPFLRPALKEMRDNYRKYMQQALQQGLPAGAGKRAAFNLNESEDVVKNFIRFVTGKEGPSEL